jgi:hypothetical protein
MLLSITLWAGRWSHESDDDKEPASLRALHPEPSPLPSPCGARRERMAGAGTHGRGGRAGAGAAGVGAREPVEALR